MNKNKVCTNVELLVWHKGKRKFSEGERYN